MTSAAPATDPSARIELLTAPLPGKPMLTHVEIHWHEGAREDWFKLGKPVASRIVERNVRSESYTPGQVFALVRWVANDNGTISSSLDIVRAVGSGEDYTTLTQVDHGGDRTR